MRRPIGELIAEMETEVENLDYQIAKCEFMPPQHMFDKRNELCGQLAYLDTLRGFGRKTYDRDDLGEMEGKP